LSSGHLGARDATHGARHEVRDGERGVARSASDCIWRRPSLASWQRSRSRDDRIGRPSSGRERDSLIRAEISLIADLNSL